MKIKFIKHARAPLATTHHKGGIFRRSCIAHMSLGRILTLLLATLHGAALFRGTSAFRNKNVVAADLSTDFAVLFMAV